MKRILILLTLLLGFSFVLAPAVPVHAVDVLEGACEGNETSDACAGNTDQPVDGNAIYGRNGILTKAARLIAIVVGIASIFMLLIGGFKYIIASGDPSNIKSAKDTILYAIIGILVAVSAQSIIVLVLSNL